MNLAPFQERTQFQQTQHETSQPGYLARMQDFGQAMVQGTHESFQEFGHQLRENFLPVLAAGTLAVGSLVGGEILKPAPADAATTATNACAMRGTRLPNSNQIKMTSHHGSNRMWDLKFSAPAVKNCSDGISRTKFGLMIQPAPGQEFKFDQQPTIRQTNKRLEVAKQFNLVFQKCGWLKYDKSTVMLEPVVERSWTKHGQTVRDKTVIGKAVNICDV